MARRMKTAQQAADRYATGVQGAGNAYKEGVQNGGSWTEGAMAGAARRNAGLLAAINDGSIDRGIQNLGDAAYKTKTLAKGPQNYTQSVAQAKPAYLNGMTRAMGFQQNAAQATAGIDTSTRAGRIAKMVAWANSVADQAAQAKGKA